MKKQKKCKNCGILFQPNKPLQYVCNWHCATDYAKKLNDKKEAKEWREKKAIKKKELMTLQDWIKIAQTHFNHFIRLRDKGKPCIACGSKDMKKVNASHYYSAGGHYNVRFDENNVFSGCEYCNTYLSGNLIPFRENLIKRIGIEAFEKLTKDSQVTRKFTIDEIKEIADIYKEKIKQLKNK